MIAPDPESETPDRSRSDSDLPIYRKSQSRSQSQATPLRRSWWGRPGKNKESESEHFALQGGWVVTGVATAAPNNCKEFSLMNCKSLDGHWSSLPLARVKYVRLKLPSDAQNTAGLLEDVCTNICREKSYLLILHFIIHISWYFLFSRNNGFCHKRF